MRSGVLQTKLEVGPAGDRFEREADAVADRVVSSIAGSDPAVDPSVSDVSVHRLQRSSTIGVEGALESMTTGHVDANWARQHHDLWYEELQSAERPAAETESLLSGGTPAGGVASPVPDD